MASHLVRIEKIVDFLPHGQVPVVFARLNLVAMQGICQRRAQVHQGFVETGPQLADRVIFTGARSYSVATLLVRQNSGNRVVYEDPFHFLLVWIVFLDIGLSQDILKHRLVITTVMGWQMRQRRLGVTLVSCADSQTHPNSSCSLRDLGASQSMLAVRTDTYV